MRRVEDTENPVEGEKKETKVDKKAATAAP